MASAVQSAVEGAVLKVAQQLEAQLDTELAKLDNLADDDLEKIRQQRIKDLKQQQEKTREWIAKGHGEYTLLLDEKEFFKAMKGEDRMICHFFRDNWPCKVMDKHLRTIAQKHLETKVTRIDAEKSPYLTEKLKVWMLPTLALIKREKVVDYVVGFDDLGGKDDFDTSALEQRLAAADVLKYDAPSAPQRQQQAGSSIRKGGGYTASDEDSDFDDL